MADKLINILFESEQGLSKLKVITGLELTADYPFVYALVDRFNQRNFQTLLDRIGFDVSGNCICFQTIKFYKNLITKTELSSFNFL